MSGASNIIPDIVTEIYVNYETDTGAAAQDRLDQIRTAMGALPWFSALKATKAWLSGDPSWCNAAGHPSIDHRRRKTLRANLTAIGLSPAQMAAE